MRAPRSGRVSAVRSTPTGLSHRAAFSVGGHLRKLTVGWLEQAGLLIAISLEGFRKTWAVRRWWAEYVEQCWFIARVTTVPVMLIALPLGGTIALQVGQIVRQIGAESGTGARVVQALVTQVAPVAAALLISGAGGSAITSDIGSRRIRDELDAMEVMGINPVHRLVTPRLWAASTVGVCSAPSSSSPASPAASSSTSCWRRHARLLLRRRDLAPAAVRPVDHPVQSLGVRLHRGLGCLLEGHDLQLRSRRRGACGEPGGGHRRDARLRRELRDLHPHLLPLPPRI